MREEVAIIPAERKWIFDEDNNLTDKVKGSDVFLSRRSLRREPEYVAIYIVGENSIQIIAKVDYEKSDLKNKKIWMQDPIQVTIPVRFGNDTLHENLRYTTFRKLVTHKTTDYL